MRLYHGFLFFILGVVLTLIVIGVVNFVSPKQPEKRILACEIKEPNGAKIGVMIDEKNHIFTLAGRVIDSNKVKIFSDLQILAEWDHKSGVTTVNIDRLAGTMEITEKDKLLGGETYQKFECRHVSQRF